MKYDIKKLRERQNEIVSEARSIRDEITSDTDEARAKEIDQRFDTAMAEHDEIETKIAAAEADEKRDLALKEAEERQAEHLKRSDPGTLPPGGEPGVKKPTDDVEEIDAGEAFRRAMQFGLAGLPKEHRALVRLPNQEFRAQGVGIPNATTAGGYTVPEGFMAELIKVMAMWGPMMDGNITRVLETSTGNPMPWPSVDDTAQLGQIKPEQDAIAEQDVTFGQQLMQAFMYDSGLVKVSLELLQDSAFDMQSLLNELFGERLGRVGNQHLTVGTGTGQPQGIVAGAGAGATAAANTAISLDELIDLQHSVDPAYRSSPKVRWMFNDTTLASLRKIKDLDGNYIWQPANAQTGEPARLFDYGYSINQAMADIAASARPVIFGDFNKYVVRRVRDITTLRLDERFAEFLQVGFLGFMRLDGRLIDANAIKGLDLPA